MRPAHDLDRTNLLILPQFWGMYYYMLLDSEDTDSGEWMEPLFGVSKQEVGNFFTSHFTIEQDAPWPFIRLPLPNGYGIVVEFGDNGEHYSLHGTSERPLHLGQTGAAPELPVFRWTEIVQIGKSVALTASNELLRNSGLLLLMPAVGLAPEDDRSAVRRTLVEAWLRLGVARKDGIETLVDRTMSAESWSDRWHKDPELGWVNQSDNSRRNAHASMPRYSAEQFHFIRRFFQSIGIE